MTGKYIVVVLKKSKCFYTFCTSTLLRLWQGQNVHEQWNIPHHTRLLVGSLKKERENTTFPKCWFLISTSVLFTQHENFLLASLMKHTNNLSSHELGWQIYVLLGILLVPSTCFIFSQYQKIRKVLRSRGKHYIQCNKKEQAIKTSDFSKIGFVSQFSQAALNWKIAFSFSEQYYYSLYHRNIFSS